MSNRLRLVINIGNTNIKLGYYDTQGALQTQSYPVALAEDDAFMSNLAFIEGVSFTQVYVASVVPAVNEKISKLVQAKLGITPKFITYQDVEGTLDTSGYSQGTVGVDRLMGCVGAQTYPAIIFDLGTAVSISVMDKNANFLGGAILPGAQMHLDALSQNAAMLPELSLADIKNANFVIGSDTKACLVSGLIFGMASVIDGFARKIQEEIGYTCELVLTGGFSKYVRPHLEEVYRYEEHLVLMGILGLN